MNQDDNKSKSNKAAGKKGEKSVSKDKEHKADSGQKGGEALSKAKEHKADSGGKGEKH